MNWDAVPDDIRQDKEKCEAYIKEQDERERAFVLEYLNATARASTRWMTCFARKSGSRVLRLESLLRARDNTG